MYLTNSQFINLIKDYPVGARIELVHSEHQFMPPAGTKGVITDVDTNGTIYVDWDNKSRHECVYGIDKFKRVG